MLLSSCPIHIAPANGEDCCSLTNLPHDLFAVIYIQRQFIHFDVQQSVEGVLGQYIDRRDELHRSMIGLKRVRLWPASNLL